ncbi:MAG: universal stress protein [Kiloniellales bacterium]|nr:universal stress protein [Kiloniellales bacterium]
MRRFKNILVLYQGSVGNEQALTRAVDLAKSNGGRLTVAEVLPKLPSDAMATLGPFTVSENQAQKCFLEEREAHLDRLTDSIRREGIETKVAVMIGKPFLEVIRAVLREHYDLVVMTADIWKGLHQITFGSTSMHLMRKCPCPVWVMHPRAGPRFRRILAAVDPSVTDPSVDPLTLKIMQLASSLARIEDCHLDIVHAWDLQGADLDTSQSEISDEIMTRLVDRNHDSHRSSVQRLVDQSDLHGLDFEVHLPKGEAARLVPQFARDQGSDLIVMGTIARSGISGFLIGDTAELVLRQVECSVLAVKPDGFVTPVIASD